MEVILWVLGGAVIGVGIISMIALWVLAKEFSH